MTGFFSTQVFGSSLGLEGSSSGVLISLGQDSQEDAGGEPWNILALFKKKTSAVKPLPCGLSITSDHINQIGLQIFLEYLIYIIYIIP